MVETTTRDYRTKQQKLDYIYWMEKYYDATDVIIMSKHTIKIEVK